MRNLKELYNVLNIIKVKSKSLGLCTGLEISCKECKDPTCQLPMCSHFGKDLPNSWGSFLCDLPEDFPTEIEKYLDYLADYCVKSNCQSCIFACGKGDCGLSLMPLKNFNFLANYVKEKMESGA